MRRIPNPCFRLLFKLPFYLLGGALFGLALGLIVIHANSLPASNNLATVIVYGNGGWLLALGIWLAEYRLRYARVEAPRRRRAAHLPEVEAPAPHSDRLARFLQCKAEDLEHEPEEYVSAMPFWSRFNFWLRTAPKRASAIRVVLRRISRTVRGA
jgi:hypothetical protein